MKHFTNIQIIKNGGKFMLITLSLFLLCILILVGILIVLSPGSTHGNLYEPFGNYRIVLVKIISIDRKNITGVIPHEFHSVHHLLRS